MLPMEGMVDGDLNNLAIALRPYLLLLIKYCSSNS